MTRGSFTRSVFAAVSLSLLLGCGSPASTPSTPSTGGSAAGGTAGTTPDASAGTAAGGTAGSAGGSSGASSGAGTSTGGGGSSSLAGTSGTAGQSAATDAARPSLGCGKAPALEPGNFASVTAAGRPGWIRIPNGYDPMRAYPVVFVWKGCSAAGVTSYGLENTVGDDAIIAQGDFPPGADCYDTGDGAAFVDLPVFDALLAELETNYCVDQAHVFSVGFSSGAWLTQLLACQRGDVLRGIGTIAGAFKPTFLNGAAACKGDGLSAFMVSDLDDHNNPFYDEDKDGDSVEVAVNHWLVANGCSETTWSLQAGLPTTPDESVCRAYAGCGANPVKLCLTSGKGHAAQESLSMPGFWQLFGESLPK